MAYIFLVSVLFVSLSLLVVRIDLSYHDADKWKIFDLKDDFSFIKDTSWKNWTCDIICPVYRWFPFPMRQNDPVLHEDMRWKEINILYNLFLFFFLIVYITYFFYAINKAFYIFRKS